MKNVYKSNAENANISQFNGICSENTWRTQNWVHIMGKGNRLNNPG